MVFQYAALFDSMNVVENIAFPLRRALQAVARRDHGAGARPAAAPRPGRRRGIEKKFPAELSGGQRKRVGLARALIDRPEILLYDEPTTGLDPVATKNVDEMIRRTADDFGVTSVVISHDMASTFRIGDRISMLARGQDRRHRHAAGGARQPRTRRCASSSRPRAGGAATAAEHGMRRSWASRHRRGAWSCSSASISYLLVRSTSERHGAARGYTVWALFHDASGLFEKSRVLTAGISVGQIEKRELDPKTAQREGHASASQPEHHAVRERGRGQEVAPRCWASTTWRSIPGTRVPEVRRPRSDAPSSRRATRSRTSSSRSAIGDIIDAASGRCSGHAGHPRGRAQADVRADQRHRRQRQQADRHATRTVLERLLNRVDHIARQRRGHHAPARPTTSRVASTNIRDDHRAAQGRWSAPTQGRGRGDRRGCAARSTSCRRSSTASKRP